MNHILLVEDAESEALIMRTAIMEEFGMACDWAKTMAEGIKQLTERSKSLPYLCVVWDCILPNGDYSDVAVVRGLAEAPLPGKRTTKVVAISAIEKGDAIISKADMALILFEIRQAVREKVTA